jgi:hypothetical protein
LFEGGYFGDIFAAEPVAHVCIGKTHHTDLPAQAKRKRVCTHAVTAGSDTTRCGFILVGVCPDSGPPSVDSKVWPEIIRVWLAGDDRP